MSIWIEVCRENEGELIETTENRWFACSMYTDYPTTTFYSSKVYDTQEEAAQDYCVGYGLLDKVLLKRGTDAGT